MKKLFKSIFIIFIFFMLLVTITACDKNKDNNEQNNPIVNPDDDAKDPVITEHKCNHICPECGKCLDSECTDPACSDKCPGHEVEPVEHECQHVCPECGKCTDPECTDPACSGKCPGHEPYETHTCNHVCPECGKCTDPDCTDSACNDKCPGHEPYETHTCNHVCPECGKCTDPDCTDPACSEKCNGHEVEPVEHQCEHVCPICKKCTDSNCTDPACSDKCSGHEEPIIEDEDFTEEELEQISKYFTIKLPYTKNESYSFDVIDDSTGAYLFITIYLTKDQYNAYLETLAATFKLSYDEIYEYYYYEEDTNHLDIYEFSDETEDSYIIFLNLYQVEPLVISDKTAYTDADLLILANYFSGSVPFTKCYDYVVIEDEDEEGSYCYVYFYTDKENSDILYQNLKSLYTLEYDDLYECYFYETTTDCLELDIYEEGNAIEVYVFLYQYDGSTLGGDTPIIDIPDDFLDQTAYTSTDLANIKANFNGSIPFAICYDYEILVDSDEYGDYTLVYIMTDETNYNNFYNALNKLYPLEYDEYYEVYFYETSGDSFELDVYAEDGIFEVYLYLYQGEEPIDIPDDFLNQTAYTASDLAKIAENFNGSVPFTKCYEYEVSTDEDDYGAYTLIYILTDSTNSKALYNALNNLYSLEYDDLYECYFYETEKDCLELDVYEEEDYVEICLYLYQGDGSSSGDTPATTDGIEVSIDTLGSSISSSYATFSKTFGDVTISFANIMINPKTSGVSYDDFIQMKSSTKSGLIKNTTPFDNLTTISAIFIANPSSGNLNTFKIYGGAQAGSKTYQANVVSETAVTIKGIDGVQVVYEFSSPVAYVTIENSGATTFYNLVFGNESSEQGGTIDLIDDGNGYTIFDFTKADVRNVTELGDYLDGCPTTGDLNVLVIPVDFSDYTAESKGYTVEKINKAFNGEEDDTFLYYSVSKYFNLSSYGKLNINFDIVDQFIRAKYPSTEYDKENKGRSNNLDTYYDYYGYANTDYEGSYATPEMVILNECLAYLDTELNYDLSKYDSDDNETIDAVILVYTAPIDEGDDSLYWAFRSWNVLGNPEEYYDPECPEYGFDWYRYDGVYANDYLWASYDFLFESSDGETFDSYNTINTYTFIHEFSHVLGADDYYDYSFETEPMDGYDMMDMSSCDHNLFTKAYFGWIESARVITTEDTVTLTIDSMEKSGDAIILCNSFDEEKGLFQEYFLIQYYTNSGLNAENSEIFEYNGIMVYHVNANITYDDEYEAYYLDNTNTSYTRDYEWGTKDNLIEIVKNGNDYLYTVGDSLQTVKFDNNKALGFSFTVDSLTDDCATLTFTRNN